MEIAGATRRADNRDAGSHLADPDTNVRADHNTAPHDLIADSRAARTACAVVRRPRLDACQSIGAGCIDARRRQQPPQVPRLPVPARPRLLTSCSF